MVSARSGRRRAVVAVAAATLLALALRFAFLGERVFHWDEARVGYWILQYQASGEYAYRAIVHGPFVFHVNEFLFGLFGTSDFVARAVVAAVGGLFPLSALLFRTRLDDVEVAALAGLLALNPLLVYYSRFMRSDVLVAAFAVTALGLVVRAMDTRKGGYLVAAGAFLALAFASKENALVYVGMFAGATALLFDARLFTARTRGESWESAAHDQLRWAARGLLAWRRALAGAALAFLAVTVLFYAPRPAFYDAFGDPSLIPGVLADATWGAWQEFWGTWGVGGVSREQSYVAFLEHAVRTLGATSLMLSAAAVVGFLAERYVADDPRDLVLFAGYWGVASVVVYPVITDISGHWSVTHAVVPLAIPAAVGFRLVVDRGRRALQSDDRVGVGLAALVLLAAVAQMGVVTAETSYIMPQDDDNTLVQYGQPASDMRETLDAVESVAESHDDGTDVLFFGDHFHVYGDYDKTEPSGVADTNWFNRLPLPWYLERAGAVTDSTVSVSDLTNCERSVTDREFESCRAPVVIARAGHYGDLNPVLSERGYESWTYELTSRNTIFVVWVDTDAAGYPSS
ncbi:flippase activity-associated protein Agl23 [Halobacterium litoreum]|uniref:Flippase activity-associated protein Agl23 n=1 Tax=Halobacterium litoreum TaxID=2039234 RepID=A0ABD5NIP9_9EURY|nr:flippase activity-associated protein Agl23 [Halobacterium litoreum]UHH12383.1 TIGR03663 family protein [Halobacterium litoreum]